MNKLTSEQIAKVKGQGFLRNRGTDMFSGRIVAPGTVFSAEDFINISAIANTYGNGKVFATARLGIEIPGIPFDKIEDAQKFASEHNLRFGGTGAKIRPIAACKGSTCVFGNCDTHGIAKNIFEKYYLGWNGVSLPHKFKITVGGCPNSCMKQSLNDFGIEGNRVPIYDEDACRGCKACAVENACPVKAAKLSGEKLKIDKDVCKSCGVCTGKCPFKAVKHESETMFRIYVGGTWGKKSRKGTELPHLIREEDIYPILEKCLLWFRENAYAKERFGSAIDRIGEEIFLKDIFDGNLLERKKEILAKEIKTR